MPSYRPGSRCFLLNTGNRPLIALLFEGMSTEEPLGLVKREREKVNAGVGERIPMVATRRVQITLEANHVQTFKSNSGWSFHPRCDSCDKKLRPMACLTDLSCRHN
ncbi:hypothetical protein BV25DRAFT_366049 [Artomyces pyxidatus]|uniref:Uncharacterized protein n=1 Tax=Artomyces pyxidatus TaxID=48021 RepID=A0ACB8T6R3_9AGAM|nr:hypothetical protein BV25DRAFT_366049 [Artomyces pyxidatus]